LKRFVFIFLNKKGKYVKYEKLSSFYMVFFDKSFIYDCNLVYYGYVRRFGHLRNKNK